MKFKRTTQGGAKITYTKEKIDTKIDKVKKKSKSRKTKSKRMQKILSKPKAKGIQGISSMKTLGNIAMAQEALVREVEQKEIERDDRSQFFNKELVGERKWLS